MATNTKRVMTREESEERKKKREEVLARGKQRAQEKAEWAKTATTQQKQQAVASTAKKAQNAYSNETYQKVVSENRAQQEAVKKATAGKYAPSQYKKAYETQKFNGDYTQFKDDRSAYAYAKQLQNDAQRDTFLSGYAKHLGVKNPDMNKVRASANAAFGGGVYTRYHDEWLRMQDKLGRLYDANGKDIDLHTASYAQVVQGIRSIADETKRKEAAANLEKMTKTKGSRFYGQTYDKNTTTSYLGNPDFDEKDYKKEVSRFENAFYAQSGYDEQNANTYFKLLEGFQKRGYSDSVNRQLKQKLDSVYKDVTGKNVPKAEAPAKGKAAKSAAEDTDDASWWDEALGWLGFGDKKREPNRPAVYKDSNELPEGVTDTGKIANTSVVDMPVVAKPGQQPEAPKEVQGPVQQTQDKYLGQQEEMTAVEALMAWNAGMKLSEKNIEKIKPYLDNQDILSGLLLATDRVGTNYLLDQETDDEGNALTREERELRAAEENAKYAKMGKTMASAAAGLDSGDIPEDMVALGKLMLADVMLAVDSRVKAGYVSIPNGKNMYEYVIGLDEGLQQQVKQVKNLPAVVAGIRAESRLKEQQAAEQAFQEAVERSLTGNYTDEDIAMIASHKSMADIDVNEDEGYQTLKNQLSLKSMWYQDDGAFWKSDSIAAQEGRTLLELNKGNRKPYLAYKDALHSMAMTVLDEYTRVANSHGMDLESYLGRTGMELDDLMGIAYNRMARQGKDVAADPETQTAIDSITGAGAGEPTVGSVVKGGFLGTAYGVVNQVEHYMEAPYNMIDLATYNSRRESIMNEWVSKYGDSSPWMYRDALVQYAKSGKLDAESSAALLKDVQTARNIFDIAYDVDPCFLENLYRSSLESVGKATESLEDCRKYMDDVSGMVFDGAAMISSNATNALVATAVGGAALGLGASAAAATAAGNTIAYGMPTWNESYKEYQDMGMEKPIAAFMAGGQAFITVTSNMGSTSSYVDMFFGQTTKQLGMHAARQKAGAKLLAGLGKVFGAAAGEFVEEAGESLKSWGLHLADNAILAYQRDNTLKFSEALKMIGKDYSETDVADLAAKLIADGVAGAVVGGIFSLAGMVSSKLFTPKGVTLKQDYESLNIANGIVSGDIQPTDSVILDFIKALQNDTQYDDFNRFIDSTEAKARNVQNIITAALTGAGVDSRNAALEENNKATEYDKKADDAAKAVAKNQSEYLKNRILALKGDMNAAKLMDNFRVAWAEAGTMLKECTDAAVKCRQKAAKLTADWLASCQLKAAELGDAQLKAAVDQLLFSRDTQAEEIAGDSTATEEEIINDELDKDIAKLDKQIEESEQLLESLTNPEEQAAVQEELDTLVEERDALIDSKFVMDPSPEAETKTEHAEDTPEAEGYEAPPEEDLSYSAPEDVLPAKPEYAPVPEGEGENIRAIDEQLAAAGELLAEAGSQEEKNYIQSEVNSLAEERAALMEEREAIANEPEAAPEGEGENVRAIDEQLAAAVELIAEAGSQEEKNYIQGEINSLAEERAALIEGRKEIANEPEAQITPEAEGYEAPPAYNPAYSEPAPEAKPKNTKKAVSPAAAKKVAKARAVAAIKRRAQKIVADNKAKKAAAEAANSKAPTDGNSYLVEGADQLVKLPGEEGRNPNRPVASPQQTIEKLVKDLGTRNFLRMKKLVDPKRLTRMPDNVIAFYSEQLETVFGKAKDVGRMVYALHEIGHSLEKRLGLAVPDSLVDSLPDSFKEKYDGSKLASEAMAEFMTLYMANPTQAENVAGTQFMADFEKAIKREGIANVLHEAQADFQHFLSSKIEGQLASVMRTPTKEPLTPASAIRGAVTSIVDETLPLVQMSDELRKKFGGDLPAYLDVRAQARMRQTSSLRAQHFFDNAVTDANWKIVGKGLNDYVGHLTKEQIVTFKDALLALNALDMRKQGKEALDPLVFGNKRLEDFVAEVQNNKQVWDAVEGFYKWWDDVMTNMMVNTGRMNQKAWDHLKQVRPHYIPMIPVNLDTYAANTGKHSFKLRRASGHTSDILDPLVAMRGMVDSMVLYTSTNNVALAFDEAFQMHPELMAEYAVPVGKSQAEENAMTPAEVQEILDAGGTDEDIMDELLKRLDNTARYENKGTSNESDVLTVQRKDGTMVQYKFADKEALSAILGGTKGSVKTLATMMGGVNRLMSRLATSDNIGFSILRNAPRDFANAVNYGSFATTYVDGIVPWVKALWQVYHNTDDVKQFLATGAGGLSILNANSAKSVAEFEESVFGKGAKKLTASKIWDLAHLSDFAGILETTTRYAEARYGKTNLKNVDAERGGYTTINLAQRDVTTDFFGRGNSQLARDLSAILPFYHAAQNGVYRTVRMFGSEAERSRLIPRLTKTVVNTALTSAASAFLLSLFLDDEEQEDYVKYLSGNLKANHWYFPNPLYGAEGEEGSDKLLIRLPMPQDPVTYAIHAAVTNFYWKGEVDELAISANEVIEQLLDSMNPVSSTIFDPIIDAAKNRTWYGGYIVPKSMTDYKPVSPENQYAEDTFLPARWIGGALGISPMKVDYVLEQYLSATYKEAKALVNGGIPGLLAQWEKSVTSDPLASTDLTNKYYQAKDLLTEIVNDAESGKAVMKLRYGMSQAEVDRAVEAAQDLLDNEMEDAYDVLKDMYEEIDEINANENLTNAQKNTLVREARRSGFSAVNEVLGLVRDYQEEYGAGTVLSRIAKNRLKYSYAE